MIYFKDVYSPELFNVRDIFMLQVIISSIRIFLTLYKICGLYFVALCARSTVFILSQLGRFDTFLGVIKKTHRLRALNTENPIL